MPDLRPISEAAADIAEGVLRSLHAESREEPFQDAVIAYARARGWLAVHYRPALSVKGYRTPVQGDKGGFDTMLARNGQTILLELKGHGGKLSPEQKAWWKAHTRREWEAKEIQGVASWISGSVETMVCWPGGAAFLIEALR